MRRTRGFSTLELMIALLIISSSIAAIVLVTLGIPRALEDGHEAEIGASEASALIQKEMFLGLYSFSLVGSIASSTSDGYTSSLTVTTLPDQLTKKLTSTTEWTNELGLAEYVQISGLVTDFTEAQKNTCSSVLAGDWTHPVVHTFTIAPGGALPFGSAPINHPISALAISSSTLAVTITNAVSKTDSTIFLFDISSSTNPQYLSSLDNATSTRMGFAALAMGQNPSDGTTLIYGANSSNSNFTTCAASSLCSQLQIIDASNPANPSIIDDFRLATSTAPFAIGSGGQSAPKSIFYANDLVYLGLQKTNSPQGEEFNIINVQNPRAPVWLGGYSIGRTINQITVANGYAYLATDDPSRELIVLNVNDPRNITFVESYDAPGSSTWGFGETVSAASTTVALGRSYIYNQPEFLVLSLPLPQASAASTSTTTPLVLSSENINTSATTVDVQSVLIRSFLTFVLTNTTLEIWNDADPQNPSPYRSPITLPGSSTASGAGALTCRANTLYVASSDASHAGYLTVITGS